MRKLHTYGISRAQTWENFSILGKTNHYRKVLFAKGLDLLKTIIANLGEVFLILNNGRFWGMVRILSYPDMSQN